MDIRPIYDITHESMEAAFSFYNNNVENLENLIWANERIIGKFEREEVQHGLKEYIKSNLQSISSNLNEIQAQSDQQYKEFLIIKIISIYEEFVEKLTRQVGTKGFYLKDSDGKDLLDNKGEPQEIKSHNVKHLAQYLKYLNINVQANLLEKLDGITQLRHSIAHNNSKATHGLKSIAKKANLLGVITDHDSIDLSEMEMREVLHSYYLLFDTIADDLNLRE